MSGFLWAYQIILILVQYLYQRDMDKLKKMFQNPLQTALAVSGIGLVAFYLLYARDRILQSQKPPKTQSSLDLPLTKLLQPSPPNICKIVLTESLNTKSSFKGQLLTKLKQFLLSKKLEVLVNCAPLKLFNASIEIFLSTLSKQDAEDEKQFMSYFMNAIKCQLLIDKTVLDIEQIKHKNQTIFLLCDTNTLDLKAYADEDLWHKFLQLSKISEAQLHSNYQLVFHIPNTQFASSPKLGTRKKSLNMDYVNVTKKTDDEKIKYAWQGFQKYYQISYDSELTMEQNVQLGVTKIIELMQKYLPEGTKYEKIEKEQKCLSEYSRD